eukprot:COSAG06_NODE_3130_length_5807_cov_14.069727_9_plen_76_part_00
MASYGEGGSETISATALESTKSSGTPLRLSFGTSLAYTAVRYTILRDVTTAAQHSRVQHSTGANQQCKKEPGRLR